MPERKSLADRVTDSFRVLTELDLSHAYERQAGTLALVVMAVIAVSVVLVLRWTAGPRHETVTMEFPTASGLAGGDPVLMRGAPIGRVHAVELVGPGRVRVTASLDASLAPRRDAAAEIIALDMVGNQAVSYHPGRADEPLPVGAAVPGAAAPTLAEQLATLRAQAAEVAVQARAFDPAVFRDDLARIEDALARARTSARQFPADSLAAAVDGLLGRGQQLVDRLDSLQAAFPKAELAAQRESLTASAGVLMEEVGAVQAGLGAIQERLAAGEGNVGRFQRDSAFRTELDGVRRSLRLLQERLLGRAPPPPRPDTAAGR
jgi:ABC-type transporter Mla subunit MlaD